MSAQDQATPRDMRWIAAGAVAAGLYLALVGLEILPVPGGRGNLHGPPWLVVLIGLAVFLAGVAAFLQALGHAHATGDLPADAPRWMRVAQYLIVVVLFASFAVMGSWVAFAGDPDQFSGGLPFVGAAINVVIARIAFGFGALICWLGTIAVAVSGARKLCRRRQD
jgi:hypothetical protein